VLNIVKLSKEINYKAERYLRAVRQLLLFLLVASVMLSCNETSDDCPTLWRVEKNQVAAYAINDSSELVLEVWNPVSPNAISLNQGPLLGDFSVSVSLLEFEWDSLIRPQFRLEVFDPNNSETELSGIAVNNIAFYCYVGIGAANRDMRLAPYSTGTMAIERENGIVTCSANIGGIALSYSDTVDAEALHLRLVLGASENGTGMITARLDDFSVSTDNSIGSEVMGDDFDCKSW
jgi:hypothetical protein